MEPLVTVGITSYKRINELKRCIESIKTKYADEIEILVSEDKSPLSEQIEELVLSMAKNSDYRIVFSSNPVNLGYDGNLGAIINKSNGKYIFFMSDDDMLYDNCLDEIIPVLRKYEDNGVFYAPFVYSRTGKKDRNHQRSHFIEAGEENAAKYIYDSILFSGLIFRKEFVLQYDASRFKNFNYFQVYLFLKMLLHYGGYYFKNASVICVGDGENAYGLSESSGGNAILANRKSVKSNLEFNKTLIKIIRIFDDEEKTKIIESFEKQYSLHSYSGLSIARREGVKYFKEYWEILNSLDIRLTILPRCYYFILRFFGASIADKLMYIFRKSIKKE